MKIYFKELAKDIIISILLIVCIIIILSIIFYNKIALTKVIPEAEEYFLEQEMEEELKISNIEETEEIVINYYIDASDLKKYEKNKEYVKRNSNPFSLASGNDNSIDNNSLSDTEKNEQGFYEDDGTK